MIDIDNFIKRLSVQQVSDQTTNLYRGNSKASRIRRENLRRYLIKMTHINPKILFLGEAPGYKGCGVTGVPFTSERILAGNEFFMDQGFLCQHDALHLESEMSATIVWNELGHYQTKPLIWNIFPFHPHRTDEKRANRTPNAIELEIGTNFLCDLLELFSIKSIVALGRKPESRIKDLGYAHVYVRHPANGGKRQFVQGLKKVLND